MTETEKRAVMVPLLKAISLAAKIARHRAISDAVGWSDAKAEAIDLAVAKGHLRHATAEIAAVEARERWDRRQGRWG